MCRLVVLLFFVVAFLTGCGSKAVMEQARRLGTNNFTSERWASADQAQRGTMVASLLHKHRFAGMARQDVIGLLGPPTGYYQYDEDAAYVVGPPSAHDGGFLLVFVTNKRTGKVGEVILVPGVAGQD